MTALFGPSVDTMYEKESDTPNFKSSEGSDRKKLKISSNRYILNNELIILPVSFHYTYGLFGSTDMFQEDLGTKMCIHDTLKIIHTLSKNVVATAWIMSTNDIEEILQQ